MADESLREALEKAYDDGQQQSAASPPEAGRPTQDSPEPIRDTAPTEKSERTTEEPAPTSGERQRGPDGKFLKKEGAEPEADKAATAQPQGPEATVQDLKPEAQPPTSLKAPESWKPAVRDHWAKLPKEVQEEVNRREQDMNQFVQRTSAQRKIADMFMQTVQPYMGMIQAEGGNPIQTVNNLLQTAAFLRTGPSAQKAVMVARLVKDFGISVRDLDAALAGEEIPPDPDEKIRKIIEERLAPVQDILGKVSQADRERAQRLETDMDKEIETFANDPANEFFKDVHQDMADILELASRRGRQMSLKDAYDQAVKFNPEIQETIKRRNQAKVEASSSVPVRGPNMAPKSSGPTTLRDDILSAMEGVANR